MLFFGTQSSNQLKFSANKPKDVFDKLEHQKRISCSWKDNAKNRVTQPETEKTLF